LPKAAWLRAHRPADFERVRTFISCPEYIAFVLTGEAATVSPSDEFAPYMWTSDSIDAYRLDAELFPPFIRPGDTVGSTGTGSRNTFGLPAGIPVYVGGPDFLMSLLGTATVRDGRTCDRAGTSEGINACSAGAVDDPRVRCLPHVIPGLYNNAGILSSTGRMFEWFRDISGQTQESYDLMLRNISRLDRARDVPWFFPSLHQGASWEFSRGMFIGLGAMHGRVEMGRAVVESIGFSVREAVEILEENDLTVDEIRACGGQAKNHTWNQMKADITGKPLLVPQVEDAELVGNAAVGFFGLGLFETLSDAAERLVRFKAEYSPHPDEHARFTERYQRYREVYDRLRKALRDVE
ncbi:MAG TPA: FGGY-family carbohydrate kinase, partial [Spirochaetia bacterium]|nr:FGGY-family carbohydrate kinase [Spirochaetia bacterium]